MSDQVNHDYVRPLGMKLSNFFATLVVAVAVAIWLPTETNILLGIFIIASVVHFVDDLHFQFVEKHYITTWYKHHMETHHKGEKRH
jgi:hypothetical protein